MKQTYSTEFLPRLGFFTIISIIMMNLALYYIIAWMNSHSNTDAIVALILTSLFVLFFKPIFIHQKVITKRDKIIFLYRFGRKLEFDIAKSLFQIVKIDGEMESFRFKSKTGRAQVTPKGYVNGEELMSYLKRNMLKKTLKVEYIGD